MNSFRAVQQRKLVDQVIQQLQENISLDILKPGDKIPTEPELMSLFSVGRSTIREAVRVLVEAGLLEVLQGSGTYVINKNSDAETLDKRLRRASILEIYEVRRILELEIVKLAAERRSNDIINQMQKHLEKRRTARSQNDLKAYVDSDLDFHIALAIASQNSVLVDLYRSFSAALRSALEKLVIDSELYHDQIDIHEKILEAVERQDSEEAVYWTLENIRRTTEDLKKLL